MSLKLSSYSCWSGRLGLRRKLRSVSNSRIARLAMGLLALLLRFSQRSYQPYDSISIRLHHYQSRRHWRGTFRVVNNVCLKFGACALFSFLRIITDRDRVLVGLVKSSFLPLVLIFFQIFVLKRTHRIILMFRVSHNAIHSRACEWYFNLFTTSNRWSS